MRLYRPYALGMSPGKQITGAGGMQPLHQQFLARGKTPSEIGKLIVTLSPDDV